MSDTFAVVTGGGTSGHVLPAIAVAEALVARGHDPSTIHYVGARRGIETRLLPDTVFPHTFFDVVGFQRSLSRRNLGFLPKMVRARSQAIRLLRALRPQVVVSVGGYASMPAVFAARRLGIPVVVVSYDLLPGRASTLAAKRAAACAVAFPDSRLPRATQTGAPVRQAILDVNRNRDRAAARHRLGLPPDRFVIAVMGGSQGSGVLNDAVARIVAERRDDASIAIRHAVGERFVDRAAPATDGASGVLYQPIGYEPEMPLVYAAADVLVGRGARARSTRWRSPAFRPCWCPGPAPPRTTRPSTSDGSRMPVRRSISPRSTSTGSTPCCATSRWITSCVPDCPHVRSNSASSIGAGPWPS